jgi:radical SAM-linked protein
MVSALSEKDSNAKRKVVVVQGRDIYEYRAFYKKFERAKYISHLDLYRAVQRTFQRAKVPVWFTEGYNPHIYLTFPMPIFLGCEGVEETFDFRTNISMEPEQLKEMLNAAFPAGITITHIQAPIHKPAEIERADYTMLLDAKGLDNAALREKWDAYIGSDVLPAIKHTKKGPKEVDLKPMIFSCETETTEGGLLIRMQVQCGIQTNLNATLVTDTFAAREGLDLQYHLIRRDAVRIGDGERFC